MSKYYVLIGTQPKPATMMEWADFCQSDRKVVARENIGDVLVSTVFIGIDHQFGDGPPLIFETMIFGGEHDEYQKRCSTYEQALEQHKAATGLVTQ